MTDFRGYPVVPCPDCGASELVRIIAACDPSRPFGVGERAHFTCEWCLETWTDFVPEPPDAYEGDGVFARNH